MNVLFATSSAAVYMAPPVLGDRQVNCGPDWPDDIAADGQVRSFATPCGQYDLFALAAKLPAEQRPDVVVCLVDASWRNLPRNLAQFSCPRVLLVADTHHLVSPLVRMLRYASAETFDRIVLLYDRHHAPFFRTAGFRNLYWFPGLTFPHADNEVRAARSARRVGRVAFVGQAGPLHPRRGRLLSTLGASGLPFERQELSQRVGLDFYGASLVGFNASLNGDLNLRVFEILSAGAALLTDRLVPGAGLARLLTEGRDVLTYESPDDLAEKAAYAVRHVQKTLAIGAAGARWFDQKFSATRRRTLFHALAHDGVSAVEFAFDEEEKTRVFFSGDTDRLTQAALVYEGIQSLHRDQETVLVQIAEDEPADLRAIFATLPRVECATVAAGTTVDLAVFNRSRIKQGFTFNAPKLWCWNAQPADFELLALGLAPAGYALASSALALFCQSASATKAPEASAPVQPPKPAATVAGGPLTLSIGIATGQRAPGLTSLLNTLMSQRAGFSGHVEIIVLDDSADADTRKLVESYQPHFPVNYLSNAQAIGLAGNLQAIASRLAKGVFTWLIGDGDLLRQNAVQEILAVIAKSPDLHFILTNSLRGTKEELSAKATDTLVSSDGFLANGPTQIASALDRPAVKFDELLAPVCAEEILGTVGGAVFRTATWREFQASAPAAAALMATYPLALTFAHTMVGRAAYYLAYPVRITSGEARTRLVRTPQDILQRLPELLAFYAAKGVAAKQIIACRFELARFSREALRARLLDADTPGLADFDLRKFIAENHVGAHLMFDYLDDIVQEAALQAIGSPMLDEAQALVRQYPSQKFVSAAPVAAPLLKSVEAFQVSVQQAEEFLRTGAIREAVAELERAKSLAPNAECAAKAAQVLEMLRADPPPVPNTPENIFSAEERTNILGIIAAFGEDPSDAETVSQLRALKTGLADFLKNTDPAHIRALFRNDFGRIFQEVIALSLGDDPVGSTPGDLLALVESGFAASAGSVAFDPRPQLTNLLLTPHVSRPQPSHVYQ